MAFQLLNELGIIDQLAQNRAAKLLGPALNLSQFVVLNHLTRLGGERSLVQIAGAIQVSKGAGLSSHVSVVAAKLFDNRIGGRRLIRDDRLQARDDQQGIEQHFPPPP